MTNPAAAGLASSLLVRRLACATIRYKQEALREL